MTACFALTAVCLLSHASDWPQWRGPDRNGISPETGLLKRWPKSGPPLRWVFTEAGVGYSGPGIVGDRLFMLGGRGNAEYLFALDTNTGKELWSTRIGPLFTFKGNLWGDGPRATPAVADGLVYALGGGGELICATAHDGKVRWRVNLLRDLKGEITSAADPPEKIGWGFTASPLVEGNKVVCVPGGKVGTLAALNKKTGQVLWRTEQLTAPANYSSPIVATVHDKRQFIQVLDDGVVGVAASDGRVLWRHKTRSRRKLVIPTPVLHGDHVFITSAGEGCELIKLEREREGIRPVSVYAKKNMENGHGGVVLVSNHLYGFSLRGGLVCQEFWTGKIAWSVPEQSGAGFSVIAADGRLYCFSELDGTVSLVEANPREHHENGRFVVPKKSKLRQSRSGVWTHPVIANGSLYLRDQELLFCFDIRNVGSR